MADPRHRSSDQAAGLRRMLAHTRLRVLPLASTLERGAQAVLALHLGAALSQLGQRVVLLDASRGDLAQVMGLRPRHELLHLLQGERDFDEVVLEGPDGLRLVPAARGVEAMTKDDAGGWSELFGAFAGLRDPADLVLVNCPAGEARTACRIAGGAHEVVLALETGAQAVTGAYALMKAALRSDGQRRYRLLFNEVPEGVDPAPLHARMEEAARRFLGGELNLGGALPREPALAPARPQAPLRNTLLASHPAHPAAAAYLSLAGASLDWNLPEIPRPASAAGSSATAAHAHIA